MLRNILLTIEYDGSGFSGWQRQPEKRTVQGELEKALSRACGCEVKINGTSRTDAGVHALGQRASFICDSGIPTEKLAFVTNNLLSGGQNKLATGSGVGDIRILKAEEKPMDFHARFDCKNKTYRYVIRNTAEPNIFLRNYCYHVAKPLDIEKMREAAGYILGKHDFACFQSAGSNERLTTVRTIHKLDIHNEAENVIIEVNGDGFLYNMVRIIVGTLVEVGLGKREPAELDDIIASGDRARAGHTAPAEGLYLAEIFFE